MHVVVVANHVMKRQNGCSIVKMRQSYFIHFLHFLLTSGRQSLSQNVSSICDHTQPACSCVKGLYFCLRCVNFSNKDLQKDMQSSEKISVKFLALSRFELYPDKEKFAFTDRELIRCDRRVFPFSPTITTSRKSTRLRQARRC